MSISISTMGKFAGPPTRNAIFTRSGGGGGGPIQKRKPIVRINRVRVDNKGKEKYIVVKEIKDYDNTKH